MVYENGKISVLYTEILRHSTDLESIYEKWLALWKESRNTSPFQSPDWIIPWWKTFGQGEMNVIAVYEKESLKGIIPIYIYQRKQDKKRQLTFIGTGNSDYLDMLSSQDHTQTVIKKLENYLSEYKDGWDEVWLQGLRVYSPLHMLNSTEHMTIEKYETAPSVLLPGSFDEYLKLLPVQFRKNTVRAVNNLCRAGRLELSFASPESLEKYLTDLFALHSKSWNARGSNGVLDGSGVREFLKDAAYGFLRNGVLRLWSLKLNGCVIAAVLTFLLPDVLYYYIGGYDPDYSKFSPGSAIIYLIIKELIENKIRRFDFLSGAEKYKYNWGAQDEFIYRLRINKQEI